MLEDVLTYRGVLYLFAGLHFAALGVSCHVASAYNLHPLALTGTLLLLCMCQLT